MGDYKYPISDKKSKTIRKIIIEETRAETE